MFFIVPDKTESDEEPSTSRKPLADPPNKRKRTTETSEYATTSHSRRIARACDRRRLKKARCSGGKIFTKYTHDGVICVTSEDPKKDDKPLNPAYVHLVETQRDQLAQVLYMLLRDPNIQTSSELKETLSKMGISTQDFRQPELPPESRMDDTMSAPVQAPESWNEIFENLDTPQLEEIESSFVGDPTFQDLFVQETGQQVLPHYGTDTQLTELDFWSPEGAGLDTNHFQHSQGVASISAHGTSLDPRMLNRRNGFQPGQE